MRSFLLILVPALALIGLLSRPGRADVNTPSVVDDARLFQSTAVVQAERQIDEVRHRYKRNLLIETVESLPRPSKWRFLRFWARKEAAQALADLAREKAREAGVDGLCVLICTDPRSVQVVAWPEGPGQEITPDDCEQLRRQVVRDLQGDPNQALLNTVAQARSLFRDRLEAGGSGAGDSVNLFVVAGIMLALLGVWLVLCLVRLRLKVGERLAPGDLAPGLLGSMFGSVPGHWIYDRLFRAGPGPLVVTGPDLFTAWGPEAPQPPEFAQEEGAVHLSEPPGHPEG